VARPAAPTSSVPDDKQVAGAQTIARAFRVLRVLRDAEGDVGVMELARELGLHSSTAHRIVRALVAAGYVVQHAQTERYRLGHEAFLLGFAAGHSLGFDAALPILERLAESTGESVNLVVRDGNQGIVVLRVESKQLLRFAQPVGARIPLYCTSTGKVLLAFSSDPHAEVQRLGELEGLTPTTIVSPEVLLHEFEEIRARGYSVNKGERVPGVRGVAAPVRVTAESVTAALAVQGPEIRMPDERIPELAQLVIEAAEQIATKIPAGYQL
jgi:IclR family acetate operon transcriptional repressor